jgi:hypothetical protein
LLLVEVKQRKNHVENDENYIQAQKNRSNNYAVVKWQILIFSSLQHLYEPEKDKKQQKHRRRGSRPDVDD